MAIDKNHQGDLFDDYKNEDTKLVINEGTVSLKQLSCGLGMGGLP